MKWSNATIYEFLTLYKAEPALWDTRVAEHKNRKDQHDAWTRVKSCLRDGSFPIKELKKKRDALMATYRKLNSKIRKSASAWCRSDDIYKPDWPFYNIMAAFLDDVYNPRKRKKRSVSRPKIEMEDYNENDDSDGNDERSLDDVDKNPFKIRKIQDKLTKDDEADERILKACDHLKHMAYTPQLPQDVSSLYSRLLCQKLRGLPEKTREIAMLEIDRLIFNLKQSESLVSNSYAEVSSLQSHVPKSIHYGQDNQYSYTQESTSKRLSCSPQSSTIASASPPQQELRLCASPLPQPSSSNRSSPFY